MTFADERPPAPLPTAGEHPRLEMLPEWPIRSIAVLATVDQELAPRAIPVSAPLRVGGNRIRLSLHRGRGSLARLRERPRVALTVLAAGDIALTARGRARVIQEAMAAAPDYAAVEIDVDDIDDHRQAEFVVEAGVDRRWLNDDARQALGQRVRALEALDAASRP